jgi:hypothetical protein
MAKEEKEFQEFSNSYNLEFATVRLFASRHSPHSGKNVRAPKHHSGSGFSVERLKISDDEYRLEALNSSRPISRPSVFKSRFTPSDISRGIEVNYRVV